MKEIKGSWDASELNFAIVVSSFNQNITQRLLQGANETIQRCNGKEPYVVHVPGAFEIPFMAKKLAASKKFDAVICLGAVIRGETSHYDFVCSQTASGILNAGLTTDVPVTFGVLTCDTTQQALERSGLKAGNKGSETALAAIEMANLLKQLVLEPKHFECALKT